MYWVLWFTISVLDHTLHVPVDGHFDTEAECHAAMPAFAETLAEQFSDDAELSVYCEIFTPEKEVI